jgi:transcriptional regulator with XRE-family HTH domain
MFSMARAWSEEIDAIKRDRGWTQQQLADEIGVQRGTVSEWKAGRQQPYADAAKWIEAEYSRIQAGLRIDTRSDDDKRRRAKAFIDLMDGDTLDSMEMLLRTVASGQLNVESLVDQAERQGEVAAARAIADALVSLRSLKGNPATGA